MAPAQVLTTEIGSALVVPIAYFLAHILPPLHPHIRLDTTLKKLKTSGTKSHRPITKAGRWRGFSQDPEDADRCNRTSFLHFPKLVDAIAKCGAPKGVKATLKAMHNSQPESLTTNRDDDAFPDGYLVARDTNKSGVQWADIGVVGEYQKCGGSADNNISKLCWSVVRAFDDPRRRFVFGYTVENSSMRMWFCDRSQLVVSMPFNFITEHKTTTHMFLSLLFAQPHQLGLDPSIQVVKNEANSLQYDFDVRRADGSTSTFRSLELISGGHSKAVVQGKTRVWKVVSIINGVPKGQPVVLKDCWIYEELEREGDTLRKIQLSENSEEFQRVFSANFLTVISHGEVFVGSNEDALYCDRTINHRRNLKAYVSGKSLPDPGFLVPRPRPPPAPIHQTESNLTGCRVHYRIVFKEICTPLRLSTPLLKVFPALENICDGLSLLHRAGWVHRDISIGNIMIDETGRARLADLEYAKELGNDIIPETASGTAPFMSAEVVSQAYRCALPATPPKKPPSASHDLPSGNRQEPPSGDMLALLQEYDDAHSGSSSNGSSLDSVVKLALAIREQEIKRPQTIPSPGYVPSPASSSSDSPRSFVLVNFINHFAYNPLHDLESVFWIAVYFLFKSVGKDMEAREIEHQQSVAKRLLYDQSQHWRVIRLHGAFLEDLDAVHPSIRQLGIVLDAWRSDLTDAFYSAEKDITTITSSVAQGLHDRLAQTLRQMTTLVEELMIETPQTGSQKRAREDTEASEDPVTPLRLSKKRKLSHR